MTYKDADGNTTDVYKGDFVSGLPNGTGTMTYQNGDTFAGTWTQGARVKGDIRFVYRAADGTAQATYVGQWDNGQPNGTGTITYANGDVFGNNWVDGLLSGEGTKAYANGNSLSGTFQGGELVGVGTMHYIYRDANGNEEAIYDGKWENNAPSGQGTMQWIGSKTYRGLFVAGVPNDNSGNAIIVYDNGDAYKGTVSSTDAYVCRENGYGLMRYTNEDIYEGPFVAGMRQGENGRMTYASTASYIGEWENDKRNGTGTYTYANGDVYTGAWVQNEMTGSGKMTYAAGGNYDNYDGLWANGKWNGQGTLTLNNQDSLAGVWAQNVLSYGTYCWKLSGDEYTGAIVNGKAESTSAMVKRGDGSVYAGPVHGGSITTNEGETGTITYKDGTFQGSLNNGNLIEGTRNWSNGESYTGTFVNNLPQTIGSAKATFKYKADGEGFDQYTGQLTAGKPDGNGKMVYADGRTYDGDWTTGDYKDGTLTYKDNSTYVGLWADNKYNGHGVLTSVGDGSVYDGNWTNGAKDGTGKLTLSTGDYQDGSWNQNTFVAGTVKVTIGNASYEGGWANSAENGLGVFVYSNGDVYDGNWIDGTKSGKATFIHYTNEQHTEYDLFDGTYANDHMSYGTYSYANKDSYTGPFVEVEKEGVLVAVAQTSGNPDDPANVNGKGTIYYAAQKATYTGQFADNKPDGQGTYTWEDGDSYTGAYKAGARWGYGVYTYADGNIYMGDFVNNNREDDANGTMIYKKNGVEVGTFVGVWVADNSVSGTMTYKDADGNTTDVYEGDFVSGLPNGTGTMTYAAGGSFAGAWTNGVRGMGSIVTTMGNDTYSGAWNNEQPNGWGVYTYTASNNVYTGYFLDGQFHDLTEGKSQMLYYGVGTFVGKWNKDHSVNGTMTYADGNVYEGDFVDTLPQGSGTMTYTDGHQYTGTWVDGNYGVGNIIQVVTVGEETLGTSNIRWENGAAVWNKSTFTYAKAIVDNNVEGENLTRDVFTGQFDLENKHPSTGTMTYRNSAKTRTGTWNNDETFVPAE